ncbi:hypothetical protein HYT45_03905 [Candidatus Uhrbacteria bacterium]|nr:hypothetical protein [Candidatus Uhrbacteria bacterium]
MYSIFKKFFKWAWRAARSRVKYSISAVRLRRIRNAFSHTFHLDQRLVLALGDKKIPTFRQLKYLPKVLSGQEKKLLAVLFLLWFAASGFLSAGFYFAHRIFVPANGGEYSEALVGSPRYINPLFASGNDVDADLSRLIYSGLLRYDGKGSFIPDIAESYKISDDFKTYTFTLRDDVKWHDGAPLTADDALFTIASIQDPAIKSPLAVSFAGVTAAKIDDRTISLSLEEPFAPFLTALTFGILPKHLWAQAAPSQFRINDLNIKPVGSGPFRFQSFVRGRAGDIRSYTLVKNDSFYRPKPYLDKIIFRFYPNHFSAASAFGNKAALGLQYLAINESPAPDEKGKRDSSSLIAGVDKNPEVEYYKLKLPQYTALFFNARKSDILADQTVRRALSLGLDKERILRETLQGEGILINSPILPGFLGYNETIKPLSYDAAAGIQLFESSGWKIMATDTIRSKKNQKLVLRLATVDRPELVAAANVIIENWAALGAEVTMKRIEAGNVQYDILRPRDYDVLLYGEILGIDPDPYGFWHSSQIEDPGLNLSGFINRDADKLLEEARVSSNPEDRAAKYRAFQEIIYEQSPAAFLYSPYYIYPLRKTVKGFDVNLLSAPSDRFSNITEWHIKTKRAFK